MSSGNCRTAAARGSQAVKRRQPGSIGREKGRAEVENAYARVVTEAGNQPAMQIINTVFEECDRNWRGIEMRAYFFPGQTHFHAGLLATIDGSIVNVALPTLEAELNTDFATVQWVVLSYLLTLSTLLLMVGRLADIHGKKRIYGWGFLVFTAGSVLCGLSGHIYMLIAMRVVQAVGAAMVLALGPAINWNIFDYGRLSNNVRVQDARLQQALQLFDNTLLQAAREVDDAAIDVVKTAERKLILAESEGAARRALED